MSYQQTIRCDVVQNGRQCFAEIACATNAQDARKDWHRDEGMDVCPFHHATQDSWKTPPKMISIPTPLKDNSEEAREITILCSKCRSVEFYSMDAKNRTENLKAAVNQGWVQTSIYLNEAVCPKCSEKPAAETRQFQCSKCENLLKPYSAVDNVKDLDLEDLAFARDWTWVDRKLLCKDCGTKDTEDETESPPDLRIQYCDNRNCNKTFTAKCAASRVEEAVKTKEWVHTPSPPRTLCLKCWEAGY